MFLQAASKGMYIDWCLERLVRDFTAPKHVIDFLKNETGVDRKNKVLFRIHAALKQISDLVPLAPLRLTPIVVQNIPKRLNLEHVSSNSIYIFSERVVATSCDSNYFPQFFFTPMLFVGDCHVC